MPKEKKKLKCALCDKEATHAIMIELRDRQGPPLKENNVLNVVCDEHATNTSFDYWVPSWAFINLCNEWKKLANVTLNKSLCSINIIKFE